MARLGCIKIEISLQWLCLIFDQSQNLKIAHVAFNDVLLIFTDVSNHPKDDKSSFGFLLMKNNALICEDAHYGSKLTSSKESEVRVILFTLKEVSSRGLSKVMLFSNTNEVVDTINGLLQKNKK